MWVVSIFAPSWKEGSSVLIQINEVCIFCNTLQWFWIELTMWDLCCHMQAVHWWRAVKGTVKVTSGGGEYRRMWLQGAYVTEKFSWQIAPPPHFSFLQSFTRSRLRSLVVIIAVLGRPNSAKSIASHPSGAIEGIWHQLFMLSTCSSELQWMVMALLCDTCLSIDLLLESCQILLALLPSCYSGSCKDDEKGQKTK